MPTMALLRLAARAVESGPDGENLAGGAWQCLEALSDPRPPQGRIYPKDIDPDLAMDLVFGPGMWRLVSGRRP